MFFHRLRKGAALTAVVFGLMGFLGCGPAKRPAPTPPKREVQQQRAVVKPPIPKPINKGQNKEPELNVYDVKTKTVKRLPIEQYLQGVVAGEMKNDWPDAALEAQAIIARTFVLQFISEKGGSKYKGADVSTDIEEAQAWNAEAINDRVKRSIQKTRGMVMVYKGRYPNAWFHSNAGGITASAKEGLNYKKAEPRYIQVKKSPDSPDAPADERAWTVSFSKAQVQSAIQKTGKKVSRISQIKIGSKGPSGRAVTLNVDGTVVSAPELRIALGSTEMKSTLLDKVSVEGDKVIMKGRGYGHGVGMSQWGAYAMAKNGKTASDIVQYYFKDIQLAKLWQ